MFKKYFQLICLMFPHLLLRRNDNHFSDANDEEGHPNKLVHCYGGWVLTMCQTLCCRVLHCNSLVYSWPSSALPCDIDGQALNKILPRTCSVWGHGTMHWEYKRNNICS